MSISPTSAVGPNAGDGPAARFARRKLVLIVDDNTEHIEFLRMALGTRYRVITATDGLAAYAMACREKPDAILLDLMMPVVDGPAVVGKLRANPLTAAVPIVLVSALDAESLGPLPGRVNIMLRKPCHQGEILDALRNALAPPPPSHTR